MDQTLPVSAGHNLRPSPDKDYSGNNEQMGWLSLECSTGQRDTAQMDSPAKGLVE